MDCKYSRWIMGSNSGQILEEAEDVLVGMVATKIRKFFDCS